MPKVGDKHFSYSKAGKKKAKRYAKKTGQSVSYGGGGRVKKKGGGRVKKAKLRRP